MPALGLDTRRSGPKLWCAQIASWAWRALNRIRGRQDVARLIAAGLELGEGGLLLDSYIDPGRPWLIKIGAQVGISSYVRVLTHDDRMRIQTGFTRIAPAEIGDRVFIGSGAIILPGTRVGADSIIGAGAVVSGEIPPGSMAVGHPARVITTVKRLQEWQRRAAVGAPVWPRDGWTRRGGITEERKASQREALATVREGYVRHEASRRGAGARSTRAPAASMSAAIDWRGIRPRRLKRRLANRLRGNRSLERHLREGLQLGERAFVAEEAFLDPGHTWLITIGADSFISPYVLILAHDSGLNYQGGLHRIGRVDIGSRVYVGPGAVILPGSQIGDDSIVEAGAVVRGAIPPESYVAGNPASVVSDTASILEDCRRAVATGPSWPREGWSSDSGITEQRKRAQREALSSSPDGFLFGASRVTNRESAGSS